MGRRLGMMYNYLRVLIKVIAPEEETTLRLMAAYRKSNQQMQVLARELNENFVQLKDEVRDVVPEELTKSPFEKFMIKPASAESKAPETGSTGSDLAFEAFREKKRLSEAKAKQPTKDELLS